MLESIRVFIVSESTLGEYISSEFNRFEQIEAVKFVDDFDKIIENVRDFRTDVLLLDLGILSTKNVDTFKRLLEKNPVPTILLVGRDGADANLTVKFFRLGAVDYISKPPKKTDSRDDDFIETLLDMVKNAADVALKNLGRSREISRGETSRVKNKDLERTDSAGKIITIGGSSGSPRQITRILTDFPEGFQVPILIVLHMPEGMVKPYAERLNSKLSFEFRVAEDGDRIEEGLGLIAPADRHMILKEENGKKVIRLKKDEYVNFVRPSADVLMKSAAEVCGENVIGVILSGMGRDGAEGMKKIKESGGRTIVQDEVTSPVFGMPKAVVEENAADIVSPLNRISSKILDVL